MAENPEIFCQGYIIFREQIKNEHIKYDFLDLVYWYYLYTLLSRISTELFLFDIREDLHTMFRVICL